MRGLRGVIASEYEGELGIRCREFTADRVHVIRKGADDSPERARPGATGTPNIIMMARFSSQKDHWTLLGAAAGIVLSSR